MIEHVGGHERRLRFAESCIYVRGALGTDPYRYSPIEPRWLAPGMQFLPITARAAMAQHWPVALWRAHSRQDALRRNLNVELLDRTQMRYYFPDSELRAERICGIPKSLIVCRDYSAGSRPD